MPQSQQSGPAFHWVRTPPRGTPVATSVKLADLLLLAGLWPGVWCELAEMEEEETRLEEADEVA